MEKPSSSSSGASAASAATGEKGIQVICCGLGRTGTLSLTEALEVLGYKPYHYMDFSHIPEWAEWTKGNRNTNDIIDLIVDSGYNATLENPTSDVYQDLLKRYPNAKVVLTVRDTPQAFVKSWKLLFDTMIVTESTFSWKFPSFLGYIPLFSNLKKIRQKMGTTHLGLPDGALTHTWRDQPNPDEWLAEQYERHNQHVIDHVPKDQLLVFNVKEGWDPLCNFLGHPIPMKSNKDGDNQINQDEQLPFPHSKVNTAESLKQLRTKFNIVVYGWIPTLVVMALGTAYYCFGHKNQNRTTETRQHHGKLRMD